jgi:putative RNA 2'-phosphotransferase
VTRNVDRKALADLSKFLSFVLRHKPESIGLTLDAKGWAEVGQLIEKCQAHGKLLSREVVAEIVATNTKRRFAFSEDGRFIRASQGHSIDVELGYAPAEPPEWLFHGTVSRALSAIRASGLMKMSRHHVHLSTEVETARSVGGRRGRPVILRIAAARMHRDGHAFYLSANGVWLTDAVPPAYIEFPAEEAVRGHS